MPALLALIPFKDWVYAGVIAALLAGFGFYTVHERHEGAQKIEAANAKVAAAQVIHNEEVQDVIKTKVAAAVAEYDALTPIPEPVRVPLLVCHNAGSGSVPHSTEAASRSDKPGTVVSVSPAQDSGGFDPGPALSTIGIDADSEIEHLLKKVKLLQDYIAALQDGGLVAK